MNDKLTLQKSPMTLNVQHPDVIAAADALGILFDN